MLWNESYMVGNEKVDSDHKEIFGMVDKLLEDDFGGRPEKIRSVVKFLMDYVAKHFEREEALMAESSYPGAEGHKKIHSDFVVRVGAFAKRLEDELDSVDLSMEVNVLIVDWLAEHVMISDKSMIDYYKKWAGKSRK